MMLLNNKISRFHISWYRTVDSYLDHVHNVRKVMDNKCLVGSTHTRSLHHMSTHHCGSGRANLYFRVSLMSADFGRSTPYPSTLCRRFGDSVRKEYSISRDQLAQLWLKEKRKERLKRKRKPATVRRVSVEDAVSETSSFQMPFLKSLLSRVVPNGYEIQVNKTHEQPPVGQYAGSSLSQSSTKKVQLESLLARANLLITRDIEWANIMFSIEQESRFVIMDPLSQSPVGSIREQSNLIYRQLLRTRRPFVAHVTDAIGNEIFKVRRPFWLINSSIYVEVDGKEIGVVHRRWHLWRRIYDLYLGNKQFAVVENPGFWNWTFTLKDDTNNVLGQIDRDWRGFGLELLTDAGQYVIRFGGNDLRPIYDLVPVIEDLEVARPLTLPERAVTVALAVSLDTDYFSRHGGFGLPIFIAGE